MYEESYGAEVSYGGWGGECRANERLLQAFESSGADAQALRKYYLGRETWKALFENFGMGDWTGSLLCDKDYLLKMEQSSPTNTHHGNLLLAEAAAAFEAEFVPGDDGPVSGLNTRKWQRFLAHNRIPIGCACDDGDYGPATKAATKVFQERNNLPIDPQGRVLQSTLNFAKTGPTFNKRIGDGGWPASTGPLKKGGDRAWCTNLASDWRERPAGDDRLFGEPCPEKKGWFAKKDTGVATSYDANGAPVTQGPLGAIADAVFTPRGIIIGVSSVALLVGVVALMRRGASPQGGSPNYDPANWTW